MSAQPMGPHQPRSGRVRIPWKSRIRGPILVGLIVLVVGVIVASIYLGVVVQSQSRSTPPCEALECGGPNIAFGEPTESNMSGQWTSNFSVQSAGGGLDLDNLAFQVQDPRGAVLTPAASWTLHVFSAISGTDVGSYDWQAGMWTSGGGTPLNSAEFIVFGSGAVSLTGAGNNFLVLGQGAFQGSVLVAIP